MGRVLLASALSPLVTACALVAPFDAGDDDDDDDTGQECSLGDPAANGGCDWTCNDALAPELDMTILQATLPGGLATDAARAIVAAAIQFDVLHWLVAIDPGGGFRTGSGRCDPPTPCEFDEDPEPARGAVGYDESSGTLRIPATGTTRLDLGLRLLSDDELNAPILPMREMVIDAVIGHDGNCIGEVVDGTWRAGGQVHAKIPVEESRDIWVEALGTTLCDALAGNSCDENDPAAYRRPPDTTIAGRPAWLLEADFAALGTSIESPVP